MEKKREVIFHLIDSLSRGGAELLLKNTLVLLPQFQHFVIYLNVPDPLIEYFKKQNIQLICLQHKGWKSLPYTVIKLKRLIRQMQPVLVHSHLFYSTLCARLAVSSSVPLISTIHSLYSKDAFEKNYFSLLIERLTIRERHTLIAVSRYVLEDYLYHVPFKGKSFVLYNFLPEDFFRNGTHLRSSRSMSCVAVGNLKEAKNYQYLFEVFKHVKNPKITLDIFGIGQLQQTLQEIIKLNHLNIKLCGSADYIPKLLPNYHLFIQASSHEGFGLSVIEAMAIGLPVFVSDIAIFREITGEQAYFFPLDDPAKAAELLEKYLNSNAEMNTIADAAFEYVKNNYNAAVYRQRLLDIYQQVKRKLN